MGSSCVAYVVLRVLTHETGAYPLGDTQTYEAARHLPLFSIRFLAGNRAPMVPLIWKVLGSNRGIVAGQWLLSVAAWMTLAVTIALSVARSWMRVVALWLVFGLSLTPTITQWDHDLMSESVALSLTALLAAGALLTVRRPTRGRLAFTLLVALAWVMTRDADAYLGVIVIPVIVFAFLRQGRTRLMSAALIGALAVCSVGIGDAVYARRGAEPARDAIYIRLSKEDPPALTWMRAHGYTSLYASNTVTVYERFLFHHPLWTLAEPLRDRPSHATFSSKNRLTALYTPNVSGYDSHGAKLVIPRSVAGVFWPTDPVVLGIELALVLLVCAAAGFGSMDGRWGVVAVAAVGVVGVYPQLLVAWHFSGQEVDRHSLVAATELRVAMIVLVAVSIDAIGAFASRRPAKSA